MATDEHLQLIERLYAAFARRDGDTMAACYAPDASFSDPVFTDLHGQEVGAMWRMLCARGKDLEVELHGHDADDATGSAHWVARYTFGPTRRHVTNDVRASFEFDGGLIAHHVDSFDLRRWMAQAMGPTGKVLGWTPVLRGLVRRQARQGLRSFMDADR